MILEKFYKTKKLFDINSKNDVEQFKMYIQNKTWGTNGCPFILEDQYLSVPDMIKDKLICKFLGIKNG
jgi:hypothetical protein